MTQDFVGIAVSLYQKEQQMDRFCWDKMVTGLACFSGSPNRKASRPPRCSSSVSGPRVTGGRTRADPMNFFYGSYGFSSFLLQSPNIRNVDDIDAIDDIDDIDDMEYNHHDIDCAQKCLDDFDMSSLLPCWAMRFQCLVVSA